MSTPPPHRDQREFRCHHCNGKILIPHDLPPTSGPCPHCGKVVTSPDPEPTESADDIDPIFADPTPTPEPAPQEKTTSSQKEPSHPAPSTAKAPATTQSPEPSPGGVEPDGPETDKTPPAPPAAPAAGDAPETEKSRHLLPLAIAAGLLLLVVVAALLAAKFFLQASPDAPDIDPAQLAKQREIAYLEGGWEDEARAVLRRFLEARTINGKAAYSIRGSELLSEMEAFYQSRAINDSDTPAHAFSVYPLSLEDRKRGIFMLSYDQPPMFDISQLFAPLTPLEVEYQTEPPDLLLSTVAQTSNFLAEPLKVFAIFKRGPDGLRVDWETFVQTKYRTMRHFLDLPEPGKSRVFRVTIEETVPGNRQVPAGYRTYLVADPAHYREDTVRVDVAVDSEAGRALSILNWRSTGNDRVKPRTATVELAWTREDKPKLEISRFLCWEFLGVGGEALPQAE